MIANAFLKIYASQGGIINRWITGGLVGAIVTGITKASGTEPSAETVIAITTIATLAVTTIIGDIVTKIQLNYGVKVQEAINDVKSDALVPTVRVDGRPGPQTQAALQDMASAVNVMSKDLSKSEQSTVVIEMANDQSSDKLNTP